MVAKLTVFYVSSAARHEELLSGGIFTGLSGGMGSIAKSHSPEATVDLDEVMTGRYG